jgi:hypothetical protein
LRRGQRPRQQQPEGPSREETPEWAVTITDRSVTSPRTTVVLSGTIYFGVGEQWDESKLRTYPAGTFYSEPPKTPHYLWAKDGEVIINVTAMGPTGTTLIPQKQ